MKRLFLALMLLTAAASVPAQDYKVPEIVLSTEKANIAGKVYYIHKVLAKQTKYSICKAYGITEEELVAANPDLKDGGLKAGAIIFIPAKESSETPAEVLPVAGGAIQETLPAEESPQEIKRVVEHRVRWYESITTIARKYGITVEEILEYNGMKPGDSIRGKVLLIPEMGEKEEEVTEEPDDRAGSTEVDEPEIKAEEPVAPVRKVRFFTADEPLRIALVLPFNAGGTPSRDFLNFYSGALMAVRDQKERGAHVVLNVYDLAQGAEAILADPKFEASDLVVGPVEKKTMDPFLSFSDKNGIPLVSPLDHKVDSLVDSHPFLFQAPAGTSVQWRNLASSLRYRSTDRVFLVHSNTTGEAYLIRCLEDALSDESISYRKVTLPELTSALSGMGSRSETVKVIIASENRTMAANTVNELNSQAKRGVPMEVWCTNRVRNMETSDPDAFFNITAHTAAPYFVDYSDPADQRFILQYRAIFSDEPDDFAFQGYDVMTYFIAAMTRLGSAFCDSADTVPMQLLHCNFAFRRDNAISGWRNYATRLLVYNKEDFSITIVK
ncbi:MAG: LysM peptidoglycan-binding domain-containing protein [Bacteroidales bacterium]|nr:LysM peptidoglycan-binding domain-containing protein [Bacteroidales bacterium]